MRVKVHNPNNLPLIDYRELVPIQGDLKERTEERKKKMLKSIERHGFFDPFYVWRFSGVNHVFDGHGRQQIMSENEVTNEQGEYLFPYLLVEANSLQDAKEKLLAKNSQYGQMTEQGLKDFASDLDVEYLRESVSLGADMDLVLDGFYTPEPPPADEKQYNYQTQFGVIVICQGEKQQQEIYESLTAQGYNCKIVVT